MEVFSLTTSNYKLEHIKQYKSIVTYAEGIHMIKYLYLTDVPLSFMKFPLYSIEMSLVPSMGWRSAANRY